MMRPLEEHCEEMLKQRREMHESERRINEACSKLGVDEAREVVAREFRRQADLVESALQSLEEQMERG